jgi:hypothetical protein
MSASTLENIGDELAQGVASVITADGTASPFLAYGPRNTEQMALGRVEVRAGGFYRASDQMALNPNGLRFYNHRRGILSLTIVSQRHSLQAIGPDSDHAKAIGRCRYLVSRMAQRLTQQTVGGYDVLDVVDLGDTYEADTKTQTDRTELRFQIDVAIPGTNYT